MKTLKVSLIASCVGTAIGLGAWVFGLGQIIWSGHPQIADFLLTLVTTIVTQLTESGHVASPLGVAHDLHGTGSVANNVFSHASEKESTCAAVVV